MQFNAVLCVLSAKYVHASLAPWCLAAGVKALQNTQKQDDITLNTVVFEKTVQNAKENAEQIAEEILKESPIVVGFSCYIWNIDQTLKLAKIIKQKSKTTAVVLGGPEVSYNAKDILAENAFVNFVLSGEGEHSFAELFYSIASGETINKDSISGLCTKSFTNKPCVLEGDAPNPITNDYINAVNGRIAYIEASRGCPYSCAFCLSGRCGKPRYFSLNTVFDNIIKLSNSGTKTVKFVDRTFNANANHANSILKFILDNYGGKISKNVCFHFEIAADILKQDTLDILKQMPHAAVQLEIGMQSFNEDTLKAIMRVTNTEKVRKNVTKLMSFGNIHVHIDLIAGLKYEDLTSFKNSFNIGYALNAHVMQLGFLKILHGSAMSENPSDFECEYNKTPPYQVKSTPWLSEKDLQTIEFCENELERMYNTGRFRHTADYVIKCTGQAPFDFYASLGQKAVSAGLTAHGVDLNVYTAFLYTSLSKMQGVDEKLLRDEMVRDRLCINSTGKLPPILQIKDGNLGTMAKFLNENELTARKDGVKRGIAMLYGANKVCYADYINKNSVTNEYILHECDIDNIIKKC